MHEAFCLMKQTWLWLLISPRGTCQSIVRQKEQRISLYGMCVKQNIFFTMQKTVTWVGFSTSPQLTHWRNNAELSFCRHPHTSQGDSNCISKHLKIWHISSVGTFCIRRPFHFFNSAGLHTNLVAQFGHQSYSQFSNCHCIMCLSHNSICLQKALLDLWRKSSLTAASNSPFSRFKSSSRI